MDRVLENGYNNTVIKENRNLYDICVESKDNLLGELLTEYNKQADIFLYGDTKEEVWEDLKSYHDYRTITASLQRDAFEEIYGRAEDYCKKINIRTALDYPNRVIQGFISESLPYMLKWNTEELFGYMRDMAQGDKEEYQLMMREASTEYMQMIKRTMAIMLAILIENYEEYLFDQMETKENYNPKVYFVMTTFHGYVTERISYLSEIAN